jgi:predicted TIM-barrel fold metal-dependent hydrolase
MCPPHRPGTHVTAISANTITYSPWRPAWLARHVEPVILPEQPIIDAHHHVWDSPRQRYMIDDLLADLNSGHDIRATVYVDCRSMYRARGPEAFRPVGEVEFANGIAAIGASGAYGPTRLCAAIVGHADLRLGAAAQPVLEALVRAGNGRLRGIRQVTATDPDPLVLAPAALKPPGMLTDPAFRAGFARLAPLGLSFDAFVYHHQLDEVTDLAQAFPSATIILDHVGGPIGIGGYAGRRDAVFADWRAALRRLSLCPNVLVKIGGMGMRMFGFGFEQGEDPPSSEQLAAAWRPYFETCVEAFGPGRSMLESNFPPDKGSCGYAVLWNAFKRLAGPLSDGERMALFHDTAARAYRIESGGC